MLPAAGYGVYVQAQEIAEQEKLTGQIKILDQVKFKTNSAAIVVGKDSDDILQAVLKVLKDHPEIKMISVEGHTDNTGTAKHTFCATCGVHPFYVPRSDPDKIDVNARCLDDVDIAAIRPQTFDGQNWEQSMAGRVPWR